MYLRLGRLMDDMDTHSKYLSTDLPRGLPSFVYIVDCWVPTHGHWDRTITFVSIHHVHLGCQ